jgi:hypothetical protein
MKYKLISSLSLMFLMSSIFGQSLNFELMSNIDVLKAGKKMKNPWGGGLNFVQIEAFDLNDDLIDDIILFDRSGNSILPYVFENGDYKYSPEYIINFPKVQNWIKLVDYNCDGKKDLFAFNPLGIEVWTNISNNNTIEFSKEYFEYNTSSGIRVLDAIKTSTSSEYDVNLSVIYQDIPAIIDVDNNGSIDILNFGIASAIPEGSTVELHENQSNCGLDFIRKSICWGGFAENFSNNQISLGVCNKTSAKTNGIKMHAGSSILIHDFSGNGLPDLLLGDISFNNATLLYNNGDINRAYFTSQDSIFPSYSTPIDLQYFPGFSILDLYHDGKIDLIASPAIRGSKNTQSVWRYQNTSENSTLNLDLVNKDFIQGEMIDLGENSKGVFYDVDNDYLKDLIVASYGEYTQNGQYLRRMHFYKNIGSATNPKFELVNEDFAAMSKYGFLTDLNFTIDNIDQDTDLELLVGDAEGKLHLFKVQSPNSSELLSFNFLDIDVGNYASPLFYDLNKDGLKDILVGNKKGYIDYYENDGQGNSVSFTLKKSQLGGIDLSEKDVQGGFAVPSIISINNSDYLLVACQDGTVYNYKISDDILADYEQLKVSDVLKNLGKRLSISSADIDSDKFDELLIGNSRGGLQLFNLKTLDLDDNKKLKLYPNPANKGDNIYIENLQNIDKAEIFSSTGMKISSQLNTEYISTENLQFGVYIILIESNNQRFSGKLIIK